MKPARVRTAFDADPIRRDPRIGGLRPLIGRLDRFFFDPSPAGESIWKAIFAAIVLIVVVDIIQAAFRGRGLL